MPLVLGFAGLLGAVLLLTSAITDASFADVIRGNATELYRQRHAAHETAAAATSTGTDSGLVSGVAAGAAAGAAEIAHKRPADLFELFYDPLGGIKYGQEIGAIGNHEDHVHVAASPATIIIIGNLARRMGLHVGENPAFGGVNPVHVTNSFHYRNEAIDVSAPMTPEGQALMARFYRTVKTIFGVK